MVNGDEHYANATDPQIPAALAGIVRGVAALNNFRPSPNLSVVGPGHVDPVTRKISPDFNLTEPNGAFYAIAPEDFATQYDLAPLYAAGINGSGETIGVINDSNIDVNLDSAYRSLFNLAAKPAQVVLDGGDPGLNGDAIEAYLDVELSGAVAPAATVNLYIASWDTVADALDDPLILAARRAIEDDQAGVLSVSFGECEAAIGPADNQILAALWEQAAAQGQTVLVSTGDSGSAGCDAAASPTAAYGLQVNGFASTPWNVAVGGTDFYYSDYASGAPSAANFWNATNDANLGSLKAPLTEQVWNDPLGFDAVVFNYSSYLPNIAAGGGGASGCINSADSVSGSVLPFVCNPVSTTTTLTGYAKPSWQSGAGVPADGVRDLPDVSLFAANGANLSAYAICASPGDCVAGTDQQIPVTLVGGTSASAQAMAGIMALADQKYGRQGQADYTLYSLAQQKPSAFHDITLGGSSVPCVVDDGVPSPNCVFAPSGQTQLSGYSATAGYDLASGLGTIDANVLVTNWNSLTFASTSTSLQLSPTTFTHGTPVTLKVDVDSSSGGAAPQGGVSILTDSPLPASQSVDFLTLGSNGSASGSIDSLPGGTYEVWADYGGDGLHSGSNSSPISVTVAPEPSSMSISAFETYPNTDTFYNPSVGCTPVLGTYEEPIPSGSSVAPNTPLWLSVQPRGSISNVATATGIVTFTLDTQPATVPLNVSGIATWVTPMGLSPGLYTVVASYARDASYGASTSVPFTYTVQPVGNIFAIIPYSVGTASGAPVFSNGCYPNNQCNMFTGDNLQVAVSLGGDSCHLATGTVTVTLGSQTQAVTLTPWGYPTGQISTGWATFPNLQAGTYQLTGSYSGDSYFAPESSGPYTVVVAPSTDPLLPTSTTVSANPSTVVYENGSTTFTVTVTGSNGPPTGFVAIDSGGVTIAEPGLVPSGPNVSTGTAQLSQDFEMNAFGPYVGLDPITAIYSGDSVNQGSISTTIPLNVVSISVTPDFILAPQVNQLTVQPGSSATLAINLASVNEFSGTAALTCAPSSSQITCSLNPASVTVNGAAASTLTITVAGQTAELAPPKRKAPSRWPVGAGMLAICFFLAGGRTSRKLGRSMLLSLCLFAAISTISCGGGGSSSGGGSGGGGGGGGGGGSQPPPVLVTYSVVVTGTANGMVHNAKVTVVVP